MITVDEALNSIFAKVDNSTAEAVASGILNPGTALAVLAEISHHAARIAMVELVATRTEAAAATLKNGGMEPK